MSTQSTETALENAPALLEPLDEQLSTMVTDDCFGEGHIVWWLP